MQAANIDDLRLQARRALPRMFFDYLDGGSFGELALRRNIVDFDRWTLEQEVRRYLGARSRHAPFR